MERSVSAPIELMFGCACGQSPGHRFVSSGLIADAVAKDAVGEDDDVVVLDDEVRPPTSGCFESASDRLSEHVGLIVGCLEVDKGPDLRLGVGGAGGHIFVSARRF